MACHQVNSEIDTSKKFLRNSSFICSNLNTVNRTVYKARPSYYTREEDLITLKAIKVLIYIHAGFGGIALLAGMVSMIAKKGLELHKKSGLLFYYTMLISAITALIVAFLPNHESPFLFAVGIFSLYFIVTGKRALAFTHKNPNLQTHKWL